MRVVRVRARAGDSLSAVPAPEFVDSIRAAYAGELQGEAWCVALAECREHPGESATLLGLAELERAMGAVVGGTADRVGADIDVPALRRQGAASAAAACATEGRELLRKLQAMALSTLVEYRRLSALAPPEEAAAVATLVGHEEALAQFAERTLAGADNPWEPIDAALAAVAEFSEGSAT